MRINAAYNLSTRNWYLSNKFSSPNSVKEWISTQPGKDNWVEFTIDLPEGTWIQIKNKLSHMSRLAMLKTMDVGLPETTTKAPQLPAPTFPALVSARGPKLTIEDIRAIKTELDALLAKKSAIEKELIPLQEQAKTVQSGALSSRIKLFTEEIALTVARANFLLLQIEESGLSVDEQPAKQGETAPSEAPQQPPAPNLKDKLSAKKGN